MALKKAIAILFLSIYLLSTTELSQLLKLPALIEHFAEHKKENSQITLWSFLNIHYAHGIVHDKDYDKDMKLPFKEQINTVAFAPVYFPSALSDLTVPLFTLFNKKQFFPKDIQIISSYLDSIWQPPKSC